MKETKHKTVDLMQGTSNIATVMLCSLVDRVERLVAKECDTSAKLTAQRSQNAMMHSQWVTAQRRVDALEQEAVERETYWQTCIDKLSTSHEEITKARDGLVTELESVQAKITNDLRWAIKHFAEAFLDWPEGPQNGVEEGEVMARCAELIASHRDKSAALEQEVAPWRLLAIRIKSALGMKEETEDATVIAAIETLSEMHQRATSELKRKDDRIAQMLIQAKRQGSTIGSLQKGTGEVWSRFREDARKHLGANADAPDSSIARAVMADLERGREIRQELVELRRKLDSTKGVAAELRDMKEERASFKRKVAELEQDAAQLHGLNIEATAGKESAVALVDDLESQVDRLTNQRDSVKREHERWRDRAQRMGHAAAKLYDLFTGRGNHPVDTELSVEMIEMAAKAIGEQRKEIKSLKGQVNQLQEVSMEEESKLDHIGSRLNDEFLERGVLTRKQIDEIDDVVDLFELFLKEEFAPKVAQVTDQETEVMSALVEEEKDLRSALESIAAGHVPHGVFQISDCMLIPRTARDEAPFNRVVMYAVPCRGGDSSISAAQAAINNIRSGAWPSVSGEPDQGQSGAETPPMEPPPVHVLALGNEDRDEDVFSLYDDYYSDVGLIDMLRDVATGSPTCAVSLGIDNYLTVEDEEGTWAFKVPRGAFEAPHETAQRVLGVIEKIIAEKKV